MKVIIPTTPLIERMIGPQKRTEGEHYRLMTYVVQQPVDDGLLLYNTLTCSMLLLTPDEANDITGQQELIDRWFLVPEAHDDRKACREIQCSSRQPIRPSPNTPSSPPPAAMPDASTAMRRARSQS